MVLEMFDKLQFGEVCLVLIRMILTTSSPHKPLQEYIYIHCNIGFEDCRTRADWQIKWLKSECAARINTTACIAKDQYSYL